MRERWLWMLALLVWVGGCALFGLDDDGWFDLPIATTKSLTVPLDLESPLSGQPAPEAVEEPIVLPVLPVDLASASEELANNRNKLKRLEITDIALQAKESTLTQALPALELYVGPRGASADSAAWVMIGTTPVVPAGSQEQVRGVIVTEAMDAAQIYLTSLDFSFKIKGVMSIAAGEPMPGGGADLEITLRVKATVDPSK